MKRPPRYDETTEAIVDSWCRAVKLDPESFRRWTRGVEAPPPWFRPALYALLDPLTPNLPLPSDTDGATIDTPMQTESTRIFRRGPAPTKSKWVVALRDKGMSIGEWAATHKVAYSTARSWAQKKGGGRSIPRRWAEVIAAEFPEVPAVDESWPNGIGK